jgi:protein SCO1
VRRLFRGVRILRRRSCRAVVGYILISFAAFSVSWAADGRDVADAFSYPKAGTYKLYRVQRSATGLVIENSFWQPRLLSSYLTGKITLFSFFYGTCRDPLGCPAAWAAFDEVHSQLEKDAQLHGKVRLVFMSLDPTTDTPELLSLYHGKSTNEVPWKFLTTWSNFFLKPVLQSMGVSVAKQTDENGKPTGVINHMLKVFLIDKDGWVREIYTTSFLDPDMVMTDIRTLAMESQ